MVPFPLMSPSGSPFEPPSSNPILLDPVEFTLSRARDLGFEPDKLLKDLLTPDPSTAERDQRQHQHLENYARGYAPFYGERVVLLVPPFRGGQSYGVLYRVRYRFRHQYIRSCRPGSIEETTLEAILRGRILGFRLITRHPVNCPNLPGGVLCDPYLGCG